MNILSIHFGAHDTTVVVAEDYKICSAIQSERLTRIKGDGREENLPETITESLRISGKKLTDIQALVISRTKFQPCYYIWTGGHALKYDFYRRIGKKKGVWLWGRYRKLKTTDYREIFKAKDFIVSLGLNENIVFFDYNHHFAHALSALFFTDWSDALLYTADGGGDWVFYSMRHLQNGKLKTLYGGDEQVNTPPPTDSIGLAYGYMTQALGYKINRHEGKLTGLAAYGDPVIYDKLAQHFGVTEGGRITSDFIDYKAMRNEIFTLAKGAKPADAAASIQKLLEDLILGSIKIYLRRTGSKNIGLAGGVFANVALNRRIGDLPGINEVFIFPGMGDEGIAVGGLYQYLLQRDGLEVWLANRHRLDNVYWGGTYDDEMVKECNMPDIECLPGEPAEVTAQLLADGNIVAIYCGRMEFGPRALGSRSILANPADKKLNDILNGRLSRTEFMPFAPYVLEEDADKVFEVTPVSRYAMRFMTITCKVRDYWRDKIPAVVHVDGTARPQIVHDEENPLYAKILRCFREKTGLPVLVNTSFNAHEEPIINTPKECLSALRSGRVDYIVTISGVYRKRKE